jgi:predicted nucleic acid-binding protein
MLHFECSAPPWRQSRSTAGGTLPARSRRSYPYRDELSGFRQPFPDGDGDQFCPGIAPTPGFEVRPTTERVLARALALCEQTNAKGNLAQDAFLAAHAIEHGCTWITTDRDFSRFPDLTWQLPKV